MRIKYIIKVLIPVIILVISCKSCTQADLIIPADVEKALLLAGDNDVELLKVLEHYNKKVDSLKFKAACYLIANMPMHEATYHKNPNRINYVLKSIGEVKINKRAAWDSLSSYLSVVNRTELELRKDIETIDYAFLVENIDCAFYAWENYPWCKDLSFDDFKEYILPYRSSNEPLTLHRKQFMNQFSWLADSMRNEPDNLKAFAFLYNDFFSWFETTSGNSYPIPMDFEQLMLAKGGSCNDECNVLNAIMKSMGVVSVIDHVNYWANRSSGHSWVATLNSDYAPLIMDKYTSYPSRLDYLHSGYFPLDPPADSLLSNHIKVTIYKKAAKVVRRTFAPKACMQGLVLSEQKKLLIEFKSPFIKDVSTAYLKTCNPTLVLNSIASGQVLYLCLFDRDGFLPVDYAVVDDQKCSFNKIGTGILYVAASYESGQFKPKSDPFIVNDDGSLTFLAPQGDKHTIIVSRKYPLFGNILNYANLMHGGRFQGANTRTFTDATDVYVIQSSPLNNTAILIDNNQKFRYFRYLPPTNNTGDISELHFFNGSKKLEGQILVKNEGLGARNAEKAFDEKLNTYYRADSAGTWIGIDLGEGNASRLTKIEFCPRTDTNFLLQGNKYALYYWDKGWKLLETKLARKSTLAFKNVPQGTLYWLKCLDGGKEERPFTYENGMQVWW